ncbi:hypothetical protein Dhaf_3936 [Desulfitobacterium hafniense DCB-2]|uniref:Uncharacterized protein n=1 Tax=Desulfitobacterium hafniense (strain DSM 10664 / DCB-2) TaxID=272564 RepID=B8FSG2_DESHD|nr:hypothetical protein [Desulfitobacterium hafniense]ACL21950.1 hypothetical protein Dhaf_3936 [Desulfitobacterium hafniense DCB-2]
MDDKLDLILDRLTAMDRGLKAEISSLKSEIGSLKPEIGSLKSETQAISKKVDMTWRAIQELMTHTRFVGHRRVRVK